MIKREEALTIRKAVEMVENFHDAFGIGNEVSPSGDIAEKDFNLRYALMKEENEEYLEAARSKDIVEIADACGDMLYILCGTLLKHGLQHKIEEVFCEIQRSNMSKLGEDGKPIYREDGKVMKGENYFKPNITSILNN